MAQPDLKDDFENRASHDDTRERAAEIVWESLGPADMWAERKRTSWDKSERLMNLESNSEAAQEMGVHLCEAFRAREDAAVKFHRMVFSSPVSPLLSAELEDEGDSRIAAVSAALVEEAWRNDMKFDQRGLEYTREVFTYGALYFKILPQFDRIRTFEREVTPKKDLFGRTTGYKFGKKKTVFRDKFSIAGSPTNGRYFRYAPGARDLDEALWCGDWQTLNEREFDALEESGIYGGPDLAKAKKELMRQRKSGIRSRRGTPQLPVGVNATAYAEVSQASLKKVQQAVNIGQLSVFEWHGMFELEKGEGPVMCMIIVAFPTDHFGTVHRKHYNGKAYVLSVGESPFAHQRKPYCFWPCIKASGDADGQSVVDVASRHSDFVDEFATLSLMGGYMEVSPPMIVTDPDIPDEQMNGFLPGKRFRSSRPDAISFAQMPNKSGQAMRLAEYLQNLDKQNVGLGSVNAAPRVAAAGIMEQTQSEDLRLLGYVNPYEQYCLVPGSQLIHALYRQYLTTERAVQAIGIDGVFARKRETVRPDDLAVGVRFEPAVGQRLAQKVFQTQNLMNFMDRALVVNQQRTMGGEHPLFNVAEIGKTVIHDGFGIQDVDRFVFNDVEPEMLRTAQEEHELYAMGQRPGVQRGENKLHHALQHLKYWMEGAQELQRPEDRAAFYDHLLKSVEAVMRQIETAAPDMKQLIQMQFQALMGQPGTRPGFMPQGEGQEQSGGRGVSANPMGPKIRPDSPTQGNTMSAVPNLGAA